MSKTAIKIDTDGNVTEINLGGDTLGALQAAVDGWVQAVDITSNLTMWLNEEGKVIGLPHNIRAQKIWNLAYGETDYIVGNVVLTGGVDSEGETLGISLKEGSVEQQLLAPFLK